MMFNNYLKLVIASIITTSVIFIISCSPPSNPYNDANNAMLTMKIAPPPPGGFHIDDTVAVKLNLRLCKYFTSVKVAIGASWDTTIAITSQNDYDSLTLRHKLSGTGITPITATSTMNAGSPRKSDTVLTVLGYAPRMGRELPAATSVVSGKEFTLSVLVTGTPPIKYTWLHNGTPISGNDSNVFIKTSVSTADQGDYRCVASNEWGADTSNPSALIVFPPGTPDAPQGLRIAVRSGGTALLVWSRSTGVDGYKLYKDTVATSKPLPLAQVFDTSFTVKDSGRYFYWITTIKNNIESPPSIPVLIEPVDTTKPRSAPHWVRDQLTVAIAEGDSFSINLADSCIDTNATPMLSFAMLNTAPLGRLTAGTRYTVSGGNRDSGSYADTVIARDGALSDTLAISIRVSATYCSLKVSTTNGTVTTKPAGTVFRWADSVALTATPNQGYEFTSWGGDIAGTNFSTTVFMNKGKTISAQFTKLPDGITIPANGSINAEIVRHKGASSRPALITPGPGKYDAGTIGINGKVRFVIQ